MAAGGEALGLIALFVAGAALGSLIVSAAPYCQCWLLLAEGGLLVASALCYAFGLTNTAVAAIGWRWRAGERGVSDRRRRRLGLPM